MPDVPHLPNDNQPVIIADAEEENACHVERQLRRAGIKNPVLIFRDGDDLHTHLADPAQKDLPAPCVLFVDPKMPGANGYDPVRWIKREKGGDEIFVVVFAASEKPDDQQVATELGVQLFVKKHPDLASLSAVVEHLGGTPSVEPAPRHDTAPLPIKGVAIEGAA